jgi:electron transfer flavoprotein beta subunit
MRVFALARSSADAAVVHAAVALGETTVVMAAPDEADAHALLGAALADGAQQAIRLWDAALDATDYLGVAYTLAAAVRAAAGELASRATVLLCGDGGACGVAAAVAERLGLPHLAQVLSVEERDGKLLARRAVGGRLRLYAAEPPALVCLAGGAALPLPAASAPTEAVQSWTLSKIGLSPEELGYRRRFRPQPAPGPSPRALEFNDARALAERLRADGLLPTMPRPERA